MAPSAHKPLDFGELMRMASRRRWLLITPWAAALACGASYNADPVACACVCKSDCGGCPPGQTCNTSTCACGGGVN